MKLRTLPTGAPRRTPCGAAGSDLGSSLRSLSRLAGAERLAGDVLDVRRKIANGALGVDETGLLGAGRAKSNELHGVPSWNIVGRRAEHRRGRRPVPVAFAAAQVKGFASIAPASRKRGQIQPAVKACGKP